LRTRLRASAGPSGRSAVAPGAADEPGVDVNASPAATAIEAITVLRVVDNDGM
jgi:hypothetical protein